VFAPLVVCLHTSTRTRLVTSWLARTFECRDFFYDDIDPPGWPRRVSDDGEGKSEEKTESGSDQGSGSQSGRSAPRTAVGRAAHQKGTPTSVFCPRGRTSFLVVRAVAYANTNSDVTLRCCTNCFEYIFNVRIQLREHILTCQHIV